MSKPQQPPTAQEIVAQRKIEEKRVLESSYLRAIEYVKSPKFQDDQQAALRKLKFLFAGKIGDDALCVLGRAQQILADTFAHEEVIIKFEGINESLKQWGGTIRE